MNRDELLQILTNDKPSVELDARREEVFGIVPELRPLLGMTQNSHHEYDGWGHTVRVVDGVRPEIGMRVTALMHDVGKPDTRAPHPKKPNEFQFLKHEEVGAVMARSICERLGLEPEPICNLIAIHVMPLHVIQGGCSHRAVRRFLREVGAALPDLLELAAADTNGSGVGRNSDSLKPLVDAIREVSEADVKAERERLRVTGEDLMALTGLGAGPELGALIVKLKAYAKDHPEENTREALLAKAKELCQS
jgi:putative nucleotidyltransferase with HDIG domain